MEYVNNTNISNDKSNQYIPWDDELMCNIPNPMPQTFHSKSNNNKNLAEISAQQDLIMINTLPGIVQSINGIHSCALAIQHLRIIDAYNHYVNIINSNFKEHMNNLPPDLKSQMLNNQLQDYQIEGLMNYAYMCIFFTSHEALMRTLKTLHNTIQNFLLELSLQTYKIQFIDHITTEVTMSDTTINSFRQQKYDILDRRIKKQRSKLLLHSGNTDKSYTNSLISSNTTTDEQKRKFNMLSIMKKPKINTTDNNDSNIDPLLEFSNYEYRTHPKNKNINMSYHLIPDWLPHPNPKYKDQIVKRYCLYGKNSDGVSKSTDGPCHELHPVRWNCFPSNYITILSRLPEHKQPKYHQNIILPPVWAHLSFRYQNASTAKN